MLILLPINLFQILPFCFTGGRSYVEYGMCPRDRPFAREKEQVRTLAYAKLHAFDYQSHGQFFWNFRTELETRWDFQRVSTTCFYAVSL